VFSHFLKIAHTPDPDDAFMFYATKQQKIPLPFHFTHVIKDIQNLNQAAKKARYGVTALSFFAYSFVYQKYQLLRCGVSAGIKYGPVIVSKRKLNNLQKKVVAIPGKLTTSYSILKIYQPDVNTKVVKFNRILQEVKDGLVDAGVLIHETQLTYRDYRLYKIIDLGRWWWDKFKLPLPLGAIGIGRWFNNYVKRNVKQTVIESIQYAIKNPHEAFLYASKFARGITPHRLKKFVRMYVNKYTLDINEDIIKSANLLYQKLLEAGLIPQKPALDFY
jgi:1,4-dihydroxy-6-naphthoate synthase